MRGVTEDLSKRDADGVFEDRKDAAFQLADLLSDHAASNAVLLALAPEGVDMGIGVAHVLALPVDVVVVRDITSPEDPNLVLGAMAPDETIVADETSADLSAFPEDLYRRALDKAKQGVEWRIEQYRDTAAPLDISRRTAILMADGMAGPVRMLSAIKYARRRGASTVVVAVATATARALEAVRDKADDVRCINVHYTGEFSVSRAFRSNPEMAERNAVAAFRMAKGI